jgi:hypothetical protein
MREDGNESGYQNLGDGVRRENTGKTKGTAAGNLGVKSQSIL